MSKPVETRAIILAAGRGSRLIGHDRPKVLLEFGGKTLLDRHFETLRSLGVTRVDLILGYEAHAIVLASQKFADADLRKREVDWQGMGSLNSLVAADLDEGDAEQILIMDADVLYAPVILERLVKSDSDNVVLLDRNGAVGDEPVKVCVRNGKIVDFEKAPEDVGDWRGESVGFFKLGRSATKRLAFLASVLHERGGAALPHEAALRQLLTDPDHAFAIEDITGLPWIEIDFPDDVERARNLILPQMDALGATDQTTDNKVYGRRA